MALPPSRPFELAEQFLDVIVAAYDAEGVDLPDRQYVSVGPAVDDCPILAIWLESTAPSSLDPTIDVLDPNPTSAPFAGQSGTYVIRLMRCQDAQVRVRNKRFVVPTVGQEQSDAEVVTGDMIRVHNALALAVMGGLVSCNSFVFLSAAIVGPSGKHVGHDTRIKVGLVSG
jgi:hypothetical protein